MPDSTVPPRTDRDDWAILTSSTSRENRHAAIARMLSRRRTTLDARFVAAWRYPGRRTTTSKGGAR
jgi:hypothetical protein